MIYNMENLVTQLVPNNCVKLLTEPQEPSYSKVEEFDTSMWVCKHSEELF